MSPTRNNDRALASPSPQLPAAAGGDPTYFLPKVEAGRLFSILLRRSWIVVLCVVLATAAMIWVAGQLPKKYRANGSVFVGSQAPVVLDIRAVSPEETRDLEQMRSIEQGMTATSLMMKVIEANDLADDPSFAPAGSGSQSLVNLLAERVSVGLRRGTRIIDISVEDTDPERAKRLVESLVAEYEALTTERQQMITKQASEGLAREEQRLRARMEESALELQEFRETHPVPGLERSGNGGSGSDVLGSLGSQLTEATGERLRLEAEHEAYVKFDSSDPKAIAGIVKTEQGSEVIAQVRELQLKRAEFGRVKERYMYKHPVYREIENEIKVLEANLSETVRAAGRSLEQRYQIARENEAKLEAEVALARGSAVDDEGVRERFRAMTREAEGDRDLYESVSARLRETTLAATIPASVLRWEDNPLTPEKPSSPRKIVFAALGAFAGFLAGSVLLVGVEMSDRKVRNAAAAASATGTPLLTSVPSLENADEGMLLVSDPDSAGAEAFRRLCVVLAPQPGGNDGRTVLFASARAGEGKSLCALNHATALAMQGHRTLLLDADLRSPGLSREHISGEREELGLGGFLDGKIEASSACFSTSLQNLYVLSSGPIRADAAELMSGTRFPSLLEDAYRWFDRVVIDSPPILAVSDALAISRYADRCCLVVREGGSDRRELRRAAELLRSAGGNVVGFVWNEARKGRGPASSGPVVSANRPELAAPPAAGVSTDTPIDSLSTLSTFA